MRERPRLSPRIRSILLHCCVPLCLLARALLCVSVLDPPFGLSLGGWNACRTLQLACLCAPFALSSLAVCPLALLTQGHSAGPQAAARGLAAQLAVQAMVAAAELAELADELQVIGAIPIFGRL